MTKKESTKKSSAKAPKKEKVARTKKQVFARQSAASLAEAIEKLQEICNQNKRNFIESVDLAVKLGIDSKQSDQNVKGSVLLPKGSGKEVKVAVFAANEEQQKVALESGAKFAGLDDLVTKINDGAIDFDCYIATPDVMQKISKVAKKLGPRGLMPSPKNGTVTIDIKKAVSEAIKGKVNFKNDKASIIHCLAGKVNFAKEDLLENIGTIIKAIKDSKPENTKGKFITALYITSTMGPAISVSLDSLN